MRLDRLPFAHTCASVVGVSMDPSVVGRDWSPASSNKARGYCQLLLSNSRLQATTESHCSRGVQPGGIYAYVVHREPTPGGPESGLRPGRRRFLCQLRLIAYINLGGIWLRIRGTSRADSRGSGVGLAPGPQVIPCQLPLWLYICKICWF